MFGDAYSNAMGEDKSTLLPFHSPSTWNKECRGTLQFGSYIHGEQRVHVGPLFVSNVYMANKQCRSTLVGP